MKALRGCFVGVGPVAQRVWISRSGNRVVIWANGVRIEDSYERWLRVWKDNKTALNCYLRRVRFYLEAYTSYRREKIDRIVEIVRRRLTSRPLQSSLYSWVIKPSPSDKCSSTPSSHVS